MTWLPLYVLGYAAVCLYWAHVSASANRDFETYFSAGHSLSPWIVALCMAGASVSAWGVLAGASEVSLHGFGLPAIIQAGIALALPGVFFFKRLWLVAERLRLSSQAEVLRVYYQSEFLVVVSTVVALLFAVAFAGMQMLFLAKVASAMTAGAVSVPMAAALLSGILFGYVVIGGMRAIGYLGAVQTVLLGAAMIAFAVFALLATGGIGNLIQGLQKLAADPAHAGLFTVSGVIQFTAGVGREAAAGHEGTALASLSFAFALMGFQSSPLAAKLIVATRNPNGIAAGQTWVLAGAFGVIFALLMVTVGAGTLVNPAAGWDSLLNTLSPWFAAWLFLGLVAGAQVMAALALLTVGEALVRHIYKPWFHSNLSRRDTVTVTRVVMGILVLASLLMQILTPVTLSSLSAIALPLAFQLWTPLLGVTWLRWITRPAAITGVGFGIAGVLLTEPLGHAVLSFFGLTLPWGRWPWTIHSALWGMAANLAVVLLISATTQRLKRNDEVADIRYLLDVTIGGGKRVSALRKTAWSVALAWLFLAIGPGLVFGSWMFVATDGTWIMGIPSQWAWGLLFWAAGLGLVWFLTYKMEMASPLTMAISAYEPPPRLHRDRSAEERKRLEILAIVIAVTFCAAVLVAMSFGGRS